MPSPGCVERCPRCQPGCPCSQGHVPALPPPVAPGTGLSQHGDRPAFSTMGQMPKTWSWRVVLLLLGAPACPPPGSALPQAPVGPGRLRLGARSSRGCRPGAEGRETRCLVNGRAQAPSAVVPKEQHKSGAAVPVLPQPRAGISVQTNMMHLDIALRPAVR